MDNFESTEEKVKKKDWEKDSELWEEREYKMLTENR